MPACDEQRKWFHVRFNIQNRSGGSNIFSISSVGNDLDDINNSDVIFARYDDCSVLTAVPAAWDSNEAPGWFYFRPTVAQLDGSDPDFSGDAFVDVSSYEDVIDEANRRIFSYELLVAYDSGDTVAGEILCVSTGPPDTLCTEDGGVYEEIIDELNSVVFRWPEIDVLTEIGCCDIPLDDPGDPGDPPSEIRDCSRLWVIAKDGDDWQLRYYDFEASPSQALISRGRITDAEGGDVDNTWHDLAWDTRDFLWGLEENGLKRILPGEADVLPGTVDGLALAQPYATINGSTELNNLFSAGLTSTTFNGKPAMAYSQDQELLYIVAGDKLFELRFSDETTWDVTKVSGALGAGDDQLGDIAFDTFGNCYCVFNDNLATIDFTSPAGAGFGAIAPVGNNDNLLASVTGLDFILDLGSGNFISFYGVLSAGTLYEINRSDGTRTTVSGVNLGPNIVGMSSCQAGEDLKSYEVPFFPGATPWCFVIDSSGSMSIPGGGTIPREELVVRDLTAYINDFVEDGEQMSFIQFAGLFSDIATFTNKADAINYLQTQYRDRDTDFSGTDFCTPRTEPGNPYNGNTFEQIFNVPADGNGRKLRACVVIGDGEFIDAGCSGSGLISYMEDIMARAAIELDPDFTIRAVGVNPSTGLENLEIIGAVGGGGFISWTE
tara:strand:+ start:14395 stop:16383 length:1989 start_codon:yes stop_codon:yes gene_type:complete